MSSDAITLKDSKFQKFMNKAENAVFNMVYEIYPTAFPALTYVNWLYGGLAILLDFIQIIPFFVHGYGYGSFTVTWGRFARYVQLQLQLTTWASFNGAFWSSVVITLLVLINAGFVVRSNYRGDNLHPLSLKILFYSFNILLRFLYPAGIKLLLTPWWCNPATQSLFPFEEYGEKISCWGAMNTVNLIVGTISVLVLIGLALLSTFSYVNFIPVPLDLLVTVTPIYSVAIYLTILFMTINEFLIGKIIGTWWESLFNWFITSILCGILIYYLPFHNKKSNELRVVSLTALWWCTAVTFVVVNNPGNGFYTSRVIDFVLIFGMIPVSVLGYYVIQLRYLSYQALAVGLCQEIEEGFESSEIYRAKFSTTKKEEIEGARRNPYLNLPIMLQKFGVNTTSIEIVGRVLWHTTSNKVNIEAAYRLYRLADEAYPDIAFIRILRASCFMTLSADSVAFLDLLNTALELDPSLSLRFLIEKRIIDSKRSISNTADSTTGASNTSDMFGNLQKFYTEAQKFNQNAIKSIQDFWSLFLNHEIKVSEFLAASKEIETSTNKALATYKSIIVRFPKQIYILSSYAYFLELVIKNAEEAKRYHRRADQLRARENDDIGLTDGTIDSRAIITIDEEGNIEHVNRAVTNIFGWQRLELITRNIKQLVPSPYRERHDMFLDRYKSSGNAKVIGFPPRELFGLHRLGYGFPILLSLQEKRKDTGERVFTATIVAAPVNNEEGQIVINEDGIIIMISKSIELIFGYKAVEVFRNNITLYMLDAYAANHESYLRRYKETGDAKVIGTAARNLPGRRKDGSVVPISLTVNEFYVGSDRYYSAVVRDTSNLSATLFIDGFGIIQNSDSGLTSLLGYRKEDVVGLNIKNIMPPPYNMFHDMFLERYRRTRVSNILRSSNGRNLTAIHADGSIIPINAIISKADTGSDNLLFKGIIKRMDSLSASGVKSSRAGFEEKCTLEMRKDGTILKIHSSVLLMLGYPEESVDEYIGQRIETLVPPIPQNPRQQKSYWMSQALSNTDLNFYLLMATRRYSFLPVTYSLSMKTAETILMRVRDLTTTDAVISIDDIGTILSFNEDGYLLLGFESEDVMGKNIKCIMEESVSANHDGYLLRYKETRVARVVGIPRTISTIHRDKSVLPIEIQVAEIQNSEGNSYIGRIRHVAIEERIDKDQQYINLTNDTTLLVPVGGPSGSSQSISSLVKIDQPQKDTVVSAEKSAEGSEESSDASSDSFNSDEGKSVDSSILQSIEMKLAFVKETAKLDPINRSINTAFIISAGFFSIMFISALVSLSSLPKMGPYVEFSDRLIEQGRLIEDSFSLVDQIFLNEKSFEILGNLTSSHDSQFYWPCTLGEPYSFSIRDASNAITTAEMVLEHCHAFSHDPTHDLIDLTKHLQENSEWLLQQYPIIRRSGDILDTEYTKEIDYKEFKRANLAVLQKSPNWGDYVSSKLFDAISKISTDSDFTKFTPQLDFIFLNQNRDITREKIRNIQYALTEQLKANINLEAIVNLVFTIITIVIPIVLLVIFIIPAFNRLQKERQELLKLLLLVPKSLVWDFVYVTYKEKTEDEEEENVEGTESEKLAQQKAKARQMKTDDIVEITNDNSRKASIFTGALFFSISIPIIAHCAWRFPFNTKWNTEFNNYEHILQLYQDMAIVRTQALALWIPKQIAPPSMTPFFDDIYHVSEKLSKLNTEFYQEFVFLTSGYAKDQEISSLLYNPNQLTDIYSTCKDATIRVKPEKGSSYKYSSPETYDVLAKFSRCNDSFVSTNWTIPELQIPKDYSIHATRGASLTVSYFSQLAWSLSQMPGSEENKVEGTIPLDSVWALSEISDLEGSEAILTWKGLFYDQFTSNINTATSAFLATYVIGLVYTAFLFFWVFRPMLNDFAAEVRHNRAILAMVPIETISKCQPIIDYIERIYADFQDK